MSETVKLIESRENERDSIERRKIEQRSTIFYYLLKSENNFFRFEQVLKFRSHNKAISLELVE